MTRASVASLFATVLGLALALPAAPTLAVDAWKSVTETDLGWVRAKIRAKDYQAALQELRELAKDNEDADVYNLLGFTLRKTGDYTNALIYYTKALALDPDHKGAREYLGELYVETGQLDKAKEQLVVLTRLCPTGCEELEDLQQAIAAKAGN
ncbi:tetratricopeptide repeat protein [Starkeya sp. ORNL1]|uniref:tetratricopeptide repeat protein n=1 Tax=Starkeya sp. ORNL1 TaxID=2709380 RepID=UPI001462BF25|nr:tetratricopeptide repeat protein [Starkeya sp. ORNL1]QJP12454.1 tetratricopeptide repeat protein [Starkeya sp. ORNL1]